jgi:hypothetical protein
MSTKGWSSIGLPKELVNEIREISVAEDRTNYAVVKRAVAMYREQSSELQFPRLADKAAALK